MASARLGRARPPRGRAGAGEKAGGRWVDEVHGPETLTGGTGRRWREDGAVDQVRGDAKLWGPPARFLSGVGGNPGRPDKWGPLVIETVKKKKPENGKFSFDRRKLHLYFTFLNELEAEFEEDPIG